MVKIRDEKNSYLDEHQNSEESQRHFDSNENVLSFPASSATVPPTLKIESDKSWWDWAQLGISILVPFTIALLTLVQSISAERSRRLEQDEAERNRKQEQRIADDRRQQESRIAKENQNHNILSDYFDDMSQLLLDRQSLEVLPNGSQARQIARARTLNTLSQLNEDGERKGQLIKFLYEAKLIGQCETDVTTLQTKNCDTDQEPLNLDGALLDKTTFNPAIPLRGIDLTQVSLANSVLPEIDLIKADMEGADLENAILSSALLMEIRAKGANLTGAKLPNAFLTEAQLDGSNLRNANLSSTKLQQASLRRASLVNANLASADLQGSSLKETDLRNADLRGANLQGVIFDGAVYNDETKFPEWFDRDEHSMQLCTTPIDQECESLK